MNKESQGALERTTISLESIVEKIGVDVEKVHINVSQEVIVTTEDKVRLCLYKYLHRIGRKYSWIAPLSIFITVITTLMTSSFRENTFWLSADTWRAIFVIMGAMSLIWLICTLKGAQQVVKMDDVIDELKKYKKETLRSETHAPKEQTT